MIFTINTVVYCPTMFTRHPPYNFSYLIGLQQKGQSERASENLTILNWFLQFSQWKTVLSGSPDTPLIILVTTLGCNKMDNHLH